MKRMPWEMRWAYAWGILTGRYHQTQVSYDSLQGRTTIVLEDHATVTQRNFPR